MSDNVILTVDGQVERPLRLTFADLADLPGPAQVIDVSRFHPNRKGRRCHAGRDPGARRRAALRELSDLARRARRLPRVGAARTLARARGSSSIGCGPDRLGVEHGGPIRFLIRDPAACHTDQLDDCANVKYLSRIELTDRRGRDTRPADEQSHQALHKAQSARQ